MVDRLTKKFKVWFRLLKNYQALKSKVQANQLNDTNSSVFFYLTDINQEPYYYPIIFSFHEAGYNIFIGNCIRFIGNSFGPAKLIYELPRLLITNKPNPQTTLLITDNKKVIDKIRVGRKRILLNPKAFQHPVNEKNILPYPMHPNAYHNRYFLKLKDLRNNKRERRVLFSGNTNPKAYQNPVIDQYFKKISRVEVINTLVHTLNAAELFLVRKKADEALIPKGYYNGLVLYLWQWSPEQSQGLDVRVANDRWHDFLATGDFFLCCPGIVIPQSHNAVEAMAVGTIPILQYPELFHPALEDGVNCITFSSKEDLVRKVRSCIHMSGDEIATLRQGVVDYYEKWLKHDVPCRMIEQLPDGDHEIYFYNEANKL